MGFGCCLQVKLDLTMPDYMAEITTLVQTENSLKADIVVACVICIQVCVLLFAVPRFRKIQWLTDDLNRVTRENLSGLMVVRAYKAEHYQERSAWGGWLCASSGKSDEIAGKGR